LGTITEGLLIVDKPIGPTSFDIVGRIRKELHIKKVGHCGTLDPAAGGVLLVVLGRATRLAEYMSHYHKRYEAVVRLGAVTDTDDAEGEIIARNEVPGIDGKHVDDILTGFIGEIEQRVPAFSAVKVDGERLYKKARRGDEVEAPTRKVNIYNIEFLGFKSPEIRLSVECGGGTYIRSLARDIGEKLGCGAHLRKLTRTGIGPYTLDLACRPEAVKGLNGNVNCYISFDEMLPDFVSIDLDTKSAGEITYGRILKISDTLKTGKIKLYHKSKLIAVANAEKGLVKPEKVFAGIDDLN